MSHDYPRAEEFWRDVSTNIFRVAAEDGESRIRIYCTNSNPHSNQRWNLQVRGPVQKRKGDGGRRDVHVVAGVNLGLDDMIALREALDEHIMVAMQRKHSFKTGVPWDIFTEALKVRK